MNSFSGFNNVSCCQADIVENVTSYDDGWGKVAVYLKRLEQQAPPVCLHHTKVLGMVVVEADVYPPLDWLLVRSNDGHRMDDAVVANIPHNEVSW